MTGRPLTVLLPVGYPLFGVELALDPQEGRQEWFITDEPELIIGWALHWDVSAEAYSAPLPIYANAGEGGNFFGTGATPREAVAAGEQRAKWLTRHAIGIRAQGRGA